MAAWTGEGSLGKRDPCICMAESLHYSHETMTTLLVKTSLVAQTVKRLPTMQESRVQSLGWEDPLKKKMAAHSSSPAWKIPWMEEPVRLQSTVSQRVRHDGSVQFSRSVVSNSATP